MRLKYHKLLLDSALLASAMFVSANSWSQSNNTPVRLAIISESAVSAPVADLLTVELSSKPQLQMLERAQIEKVYREQGLSAANRDYLKLGQVLGADGLMLLTPASEGTNQFLQVRLVAVKPGVVIGTVRSIWPLEDSAGWAHWLASHFDPLFPKLGVLAKDALPISVVNLRAAVRLSEEQDLERQLTALVIERLTCEPELFVLERRRMDLLGVEKELKTLDESSFWNGSYLLDGVINQAGYSREKVTINARLSPPKGGASVAIEISGSRTNLADLVNEFAVKVMDGLKLRSRSVPWSPLDEAQKYYEEVNWALRWGMTREAQTASESAWAMGKQDMECAMARVKSYMADLSSDWPGYERGVFENGTSNPTVTDDYIQRMLSKHSLGIAFRRRGNRVEYSFVTKTPDSESLDLAIRFLCLYEQFSRTLPPEEQKPGSPWYRMGIEVLERASRVLQYFHLVSESQKPAPDKVAELRAQARAVAAWMSRSPWVQICYSPGDSSVGEGLTFFACKVNCGAFWQERPEDCIALYRELVTNPMFAHIHEGLWYRKPECPPITAWNSEDRKRVPVLWHGFLQELIASPNPFVQIEGRFLRLNDAENEAEWEVSFNALFDTIFTNRTTIVTNSFGLRCSEWGIEGLIGGWGALRGRGGGYKPPGTEKLRNRYFSEYRSRLKAMDEECQANTRQRITQNSRLAAFNKQKDFLHDFCPYESKEFVDTFRFADYSPAQAAELQPLLLAYKSNLTTQAAGKSGLELLRLRGGLRQVASVEKALEVALNPASETNEVQLVTLTNTRTIAAANQFSKASAHSAAVAPRPILASSIEPAGRSPASVLALTQLWSPPSREALDSDTEAQITDVRYRANRLWIECNCGYRQKTWSIFVVNPQTLQTERRLPIASYSMSDNHYFARPQWEVLNDILYLSEPDHLKKFSLRQKTWSDFPVPVKGQFSFSVIGDRLYLSGKDSIVEFDPGTGTTRLMASSRRNPASSILDNRSVYNSPPIVGGTNGVPRVLLDGRFFSYLKERNDWVETDTIPEYISYPERQSLSVQNSVDGVLVYCHVPYHINRAYLMRDSPKLEVLFEHQPESSLIGSPVKASPALVRWTLPEGLVPTYLPMDWDGKNLWVLAAPSGGAAPDHFWYFGEEQREPIAVGLRFNLRIQSEGSASLSSDDFAVSQLRCTPAGLVVVGSARISDAEKSRLPGPVTVVRGGAPVIVKEGVAQIVENTSRLCFVPRAELEVCIQQAIGRNAGQSRRAYSDDPSKDSSP